MRLKLYSFIPDKLKKELLVGLSLDGLFRPHFQSDLDQLESSSYALEQVRRHVTRPHSDLHSPRSTGCWQEHRHCRLQRRSTAAATSSGDPIHDRLQKGTFTVSTATRGPTEQWRSSAGAFVVLPATGDTEEAGEEMKCVVIIVNVFK